MVMHPLLPHGWLAGCLPVCLGHLQYHVVSDHSCDSTVCLKAHGHVATACLGQLDLHHLGAACLFLQLYSFFTFTFVVLGANTGTVNIKENLCNIWYSFNVQHVRPSSSHYS